MNGGEPSGTLKVSHGHTFKATFVFSRKIETTDEGTSCLAIQTPATGLIHPPLMLPAQLTLPNGTLFLGQQLSQHCPYCPGIQVDSQTVFVINVPCSHPSSFCGPLTDGSIRSPSGVMMEHLRSQPTSFYKLTT